MRWLWAEYRVAILCQILGWISVLLLLGIFVQRVAANERSRVSHPRPPAVRYYPVRPGYIKAPGVTVIWGTPYRLYYPGPGVWVGKHYYYPCPHCR